MSSSAFVADEVVESVVGLGHPDDLSPNGDSFGNEDAEAVVAAPAAVEAAKDNFAELTEAVFRDRRGDQEFLMAEGMSVADILLTTCIQSALRRKISLPEYLISYNDRVSQRPAFQRALAANTP